MEATFEFAAITFSRVNLTSFAVIWLPSWKVTFSLSLNSQVFSSSCSQEVASPGFREKSSFAPTRVSVTAAFSQISVPPLPSIVLIESISHISPRTSVLSSESPSTWETASDPEAISIPETASFSSFSSVLLHPEITRKEQISRVINNMNRGELLFFI
ncbi:hypothetical protein SDC9_156902 [bioreactor metagenome]|uniref:Uncharacterized protein n=1 Tax=bioreactor metagenome TaxID=1076179 RepID=A0A645F5S0_9ZZZZ